MLFTLQSLMISFPYTFLNKFEVMSFILEVKQQIYVYTLYGTIVKTYAIHFVKFISVHILKCIWGYVESFKVMQKIKFCNKVR